MVSEEKQNFAEIELMAFFVHLMPSIYNPTFFIMRDQLDVMMGGAGRADFAAPCERLVMEEIGKIPRTVGFGEARLGKGASEIRDEKGKIKTTLRNVLCNGGGSN